MLLSHSPGFVILASTTSGIHHDGQLVETRSGRDSPQ